MRISLCVIRPVDGGILDGVENCGVEDCGGDRGVETLDIADDIGASLVETIGLLDTGWLGADDSAAVVRLDIADGTEEGATDVGGLADVAGLESADVGRVAWVVGSGRLV